MMSAFNDIIEMLKDDMVSHGFLAQHLSSCCEGVPLTNEQVGSVLSELLSSGKVEIGETEQSKPDYVEFIAWKGTVAERVDRALNTVARTATDWDRTFAYWLALRENVDRFEEDHRVP
jgi:hypothetical protein